MTLTSNNVNVIMTSRPVLMTLVTRKGRWKDCTLSVSLVWTIKVLEMVEISQTG